MKIKKENGMGNITLIISILAIILLVVGVVMFIQNELKNEKIETLRTDMISIQAKIKIIAEEHNMNEENNELKGEILSESKDEEIINLINIGIVSNDEEIKNYYILNKENLEEMNLYNIGIDRVVVNYSDYEIILINGIEVDGTVYYKLSDIKDIKNKTEKQENIEQIEE